MATNKKMNETGWFYHAPPKRQAKPEPVPVPIASQIPGLNYDLPQDTEIPRSLFRDTDTKYIRLAKQGGRQNLLQFKENKNMREKEPVGYHRSEWFYLEDNALEDAEKDSQASEPYKFMVPEYMVHEAANANGTESTTYERPGRAPFSYDNVSAYEREGDSIRDKTIRLPEVRKAGFGVRSAKPFKSVRPVVRDRRLPISSAKTSQMDKNNPPLKYLPLPEGAGMKENPKMSKLLSFAYEKEWQDEVRKWEYKQDKIREQHKSMLASQGPSSKDTLASEYALSIGKPKPPVYHPEKSSRKVWDAQSTSMKSTMSKSKTEKSDDKELFKMTRFRNIPSKTDSHMSKTVLAAAH